MRPRVDFLRGAMREFMGKEIPEEAWELSIMSVISLCAFLEFKPRARERVLRRHQQTGNPVDRLTAHTIRFALAGLRVTRDVLLKEAGHHRDAPADPGLSKLEGERQHGCA